MKLVISDLTIRYGDHTLRPLWLFDDDDKDVVIWLLVLHCGRDKAACNAV